MAGSRGEQSRRDAWGACGAWLEAEGSKAAETHAALCQQRRRGGISAGAHGALPQAATRAVAETPTRRLARKQRGQH